MAATLVTPFPGTCAHHHRRRETRCVQSRVMLLARVCSSSIYIYLHKREVSFVRECVHRENVHDAIRILFWAIFIIHLAIVLARARRTRWATSR